MDDARLQEIRERLDPICKQFGPMVACAVTEELPDYADQEEIGKVKPGQVYVFVTVPHDFGDRYLDLEKRLREEDVVGCVFLHILPPNR